MWRISLLATFAVLGVLCLNACNKMEEAQRGIVLESGVDKKPGSVEDYSGDTSLQVGNSQYDSEYKNPAASAKQPYEGKAEDPQRKDPTSPTLLAGDTLGHIKTWFSPAAYAADTNIDEKYLIRTGEVNISVEDFNKSVDEVYKLSERLDGIVTDSDISNDGDNERSGWITVRVPNTRFFEAFNALSKLGEVQSQKVNSEDASREYVAAVSRIQNLRLEQDTLRKMLDQALAVQKARGLGEGYSILLDTQQRLSDVTGKIQETEDSLSQLADKITRSTIKVNLTQAAKYEPAQFTWGLGATFEQSKAELLAVVRGVGQSLIHFGVVGWLYLLPWLLIGWVSLRVYRKYIAPRLKEEKKAVAEV
jgi:hypothetical protein